MMEFSTDEMGSFQEYFIFFNTYTINQVLRWNESTHGDWSLIAEDYKKVLKSVDELR